MLAGRGVASRRAAERLIEQGRVRVNGATAELGLSVDADRAVIEVDGRLIQASSELRYVALYKPVGYVTSTASEHGERTVMALVNIEERIFPVGRLDLDSAGLLLLTNDGEWANLVTHPRYEIEKEYVAIVRGHPSSPQVEALRGGIRLSSGELTSAAKVETLHRGESTTTLNIVVHEGKKRQIRLMMAAVGHPVMKLTRVRVGPVRLGTLANGTWRELTQAEVRDVRTLARANNRISHA